jgi:hypothetical protein
MNGGVGAGTQLPREVAQFHSLSGASREAGFPVVKAHLFEHFVVA